MNYDQPMSPVEMALLERVRLLGDLLDLAALDLGAENLLLAADPLHPLRGWTGRPSRGPILDAAYLHAARSAGAVATRDDRAAVWVEENGERCEEALTIEGLNGRELLARIDPGRPAEQEFSARMHVVLDTLHLQADHLLALAEEVR